VRRAVYACPFHAISWTHRPKLKHLPHVYEGFPEVGHGGVDPCALAGGGWVVIQ
jgi:hypothetical protein